MNKIQFFESDFFSHPERMCHRNPKTYTSKRKGMASLNNAVRKLWEGGMTPDEIRIKSKPKCEDSTGG